MPLRLIDSSVWARYLRPRPDRKIVEAVRRALSAAEAGVAAPVVVEVLSGIRDPDEYRARESDFQALTQIPVNGEAAYVAARLGEALARRGQRSTTVDLLLAGGAIVSGAELWALPDAHFERIQAVIDRDELALPGPFHYVTLG